VHCWRTDATAATTRRPNGRSLIEPFRRLIHSVVVHATSGVMGFEVEIKGRRHQLIERPLLGGERP
jgi:hypothetical protein